MPNEVDAGVQPMHSPSANPLLDSPSSKPNLFKLTSADHPVLPLRDLSQPPVIIASPRKNIFRMTFRGLGGHAPKVARNIARVARASCGLSRGTRA
jgi:hypothetical protein